ncbi:MAG: hypothetical protein PPHEMADMSA_1421 [uncultured Paraburkholderia sp.]|nr:MAG: hypothetical protein PPHEMADMSA_1421 [uncultured Paraburkholderia sp.]
MDSKVSGTKKRNKTAGAYSRIPGHDMGGCARKREFAASGGFTGAARAAAPCARAAAIYVRIDKLYPAPRIVVFSNGAPRDGVNPRFACDGRVFRLAAARLCAARAARKNASFCIFGMRFCVP